MNIVFHEKKGDWDLCVGREVVGRGLTCGVIYSAGRKVLATEYPKHEMEAAEDSGIMKIVHSGLKDFPSLIQEIIIPKNSSFVHTLVQVIAERSSLKIEEIQPLVYSLKEDNCPWLGKDKHKMWLFRHGMAMPSDDVGFYPIDESVKENWVVVKDKKKVFSSEALSVFKREKYSFGRFYIFSGLCYEDRYF